MRRRVEPVLRERINGRDEVNALVQWLLDQRGAGHPWRDMVVLAPGKRNWRDPIAGALARERIPYRMLLGDKQLEPDPTGDHVHVMTLYAAQDLEYPVVAVVGVGDFPWKSQTLEEAATLVDMAMSRATRALLVSHSKPSALVERLLAT